MCPSTKLSPDENKAIKNSIKIKSTETEKQWKRYGGKH